MPSKLSSSTTLFWKWGMPAWFLFVWLVIIKLALQGPAGHWLLVIWGGILCIFCFYFTSTIKVVTIAGDHFIIFDGFTKHRVPIAHLTQITRGRSIRQPSSILLEFEPPTPFGREVHIITPRGFTDKKYYEIKTFLQSLIDNRELP